MFRHRSAQEVMELALTENRILLTEDKDFCWLCSQPESTHQV